MAVAWTYENAAHLLQRVAFSGTPAEIAAFHKRHGSVESAVDELLSYKPSKKQPSKPKKNRDHVQDMQSWWLVEMLKAKKPADAAREKMVLFFHGHLCSGVSKQPDSNFMAIQNGFFRLNAQGNYKSIMRAFNRDPANLYYLDGITNFATTDFENDVPRVDANENFGRELLELFCLGVYQLNSDGAFDTNKPNYTEDDVHQLSRALTGWTDIDKKGIATWNPELPHWDGGRCDDNADGVADPVTIFGVTNSNFRIDDAIAGTPDDVLELIFSRKDDEGNNTVAMHLTRKLWTFFAYKPPAAGLKAIFASLAQIFTTANFEITPLLRAMFTHDEFYSVRAMTRTVKNPVDYAVQAMRALGLNKSDAGQIGENFRTLGRQLARMGMELFEPPNVAGWPGGLAWINSGTLLARLEFAKDLAAADGKKTKLDFKKGLPLPIGAAGIPPEMVVDAIINQLSLNIGPLAFTSNERGELLGYATSKKPQLDLSKESDDVEIKVRGILSLALQAPSYMVF